LSRHSRKRFERIYTRRAQQGFPPVSPLVLHKNGSITERPRPGVFRSALVTTPFFVEPARGEDVKTCQKSLGAPSDSLSILGKIRRFFGRLFSEHWYLTDSI
jgi:hypothetical protein